VEKPIIRAHPVALGMTELVLPLSYQILSVRKQHGAWKLWELSVADDRNPPMKVKICSFLTGEAIPNGVYIDTVVDGDSVWHWWEVWGEEVPSFAKKVESS